MARASQTIQDLVDAFRAGIQTYREERTSEAVIRGEYIDPFWSLLGWDVANRAHRSEAEKDVVLEAPVTSAESRRLRNRRPDYLFRIDGFPRFVVEAKKPSLGSDADRDAVFQAKTYAWSAQIPFAILMDFERFRLFDATVKPYHDDPLRGVVSDFDVRFENYPTQWDVLSTTFSRDSVANGSLEQLLARVKRVRRGQRVRGVDRLLFDVRGTEPVDRVFLSHLESYRLRLAQDVFRANRSEFPEPGTRHGAARLTEAVQRLLDRIVFMRTCEDRGIVSYGKLREALSEAADEGVDLSASLVSIFRDFDRQYNGYLFKAHFSESLRVTPSILADLIRSLYPPDGPYRFDAIGDDLLGIIYERFLGNALTVNRGVVQAEPKPEVRHAGGVYYTPRFIVDSLVRRTLGPAIATKSPEEILSVRVLDPACGSGSFLITAYQQLMDHCLRAVQADPSLATPRRRRRSTDAIPRVAVRNGHGELVLSPEFRGRLLTSCIFGVDIDAQAVEVTIMSLYLKMLEGGLPGNWQRELQFGRLLPPLDNNIRCGNSLLEPDAFDRFWEERHGTLFDPDEELRFRMNAFDWESSTLGFGRVLDQTSGFDAVVGNPPYIRVQSLQASAPEECTFYKWRYSTAAAGNFDIYVPFIERGIELLAPHGRLGFICPQKFWQSNYGAALRDLVATQRSLREVVDFTDQQVFRDVTTYTAVHVFGKDANTGEVDFARVTHLYDGPSQCSALDSGEQPRGTERFGVPHPRIGQRWAFARESEYAWSEAVAEKGPRLTEIADVFVGVQTSADVVYHFDVSYSERSRTIRSRVDGTYVDIEPEALRPLISGPDVGRCVLNTTRQAVLFPYEWDARRPALLDADEMHARWPLAWEYLLRHEPTLRSRESGTFDDDQWYRFGRSQNISRQRGTKVCVRRMSETLQCGYDSEGTVCLDNVDVNGVRVRAEYAAAVDQWYLCGLLNSTLLDAYLKIRFRSRFRGGFMSFNKQFLGETPILIPQDRRTKHTAEEIAERAQRSASLRLALLDPRLSETDRTSKLRAVEADQQRVDRLVCDLYDSSLPQAIPSP